MPVAGTIEIELFSVRELCLVVVGRAPGDKHHLPRLHLPAGDLRVVPSSAADEDERTIQPQQLLHCS
jgi:hypothetical protein